MKPRNYLIVAMYAILAMGNCQVESNNVELLTKGNNQFTAKMFSEVAKGYGDKSFVLSAFSVLTPLAQLSLASDGNTHYELLNAIGLPDDESIKSGFSHINKKLLSIEGLDLRLANIIYVADMYALNENYTHIFREIFQSEVASVDFTKSQQTSERINAWVDDHTNHRITDVVNPSSLTEKTKILLVNAIYFKGTWKYTFDKSLTRNRNFYVSHENAVSVPMMFRKGNFYYGENAELNAKVLGIPYVGDKSSFYIILPNNIDGVTKIRDKLKDPSILGRALENLSDLNVNAYIPKFKITTSINLQQILSQIGVNSIFNETKANLKKLIKGNADLYVNDAIQKAFLEINEEGAEAAAVNAFDVLWPHPLPPLPIIEFVADHPFMFILKVEEIILFSGIYSP